MKKHITKTSLIITIAVIICCISAVMTNNAKKTGDTVRYKDKTYALLEYNADIFTYFFKAYGYLEEDTICPVLNNKWDAVYFNGDVFIEEKQADNAIKYYADDRNYNWFVTFEKNDSEKALPLDITKKELNYIYGMESLNRQKTMVFDDIEQFASIEKVSKDNLVIARITLARCDNYWYWKTEIMTENDKEYIIPLPKTLNEKLCALVK